MSLRPDLARAWRALDQLPQGAVVLDGYGHAWQQGFPYWYRAWGDGEPTSTWELCQRAPITVLHDLNTCHVTVTTRKGNEKPCGEPSGRKRWAFDKETGAIHPACDRHQTFMSAMGDQQ